VKNASEPEHSGETPAPADLRVAAVVADTTRAPAESESRQDNRTSVAARLVATFFGVGKLRPGPGTWASAATTLLWAALAAAMVPSLRTSVAILAAVLVVLIGIPSATRVARDTGIKDPQFVVIDEVAGQLVALIAVPLAWKSFVAGFILFRVFDILKPPPVRQLEAIPDGAGIVLDDVAAGLYALLIVHLLMRIGLLN
jgi:phosphatidylglycerophosphatase A